MATKTSNISNGSNRTRMDDLDDHMLIEILIRLPNCVTVQTCSPVNKRWFSLISDSNFPVQFANHKKKTTNLLMGSGFNHEDDDPPWTFVTTIVEISQLSGPVRQLGKKIKFIFKSPKLSLKFLPGNYFTTMATFKDLVLCSSYEAYEKGGRVYYITNPLTKQWVALPPCPIDKHQRKRMTAFLICQPPYNYTQHYKFRVVEVRNPLTDHNPIYVDKFDLVVYCSEIGEWKEIQLRAPNVVEVGELETVVCNGIIYFKSGLHLVGFDPFDVNNACDTTLEARVMPPLPDFGYLQEYSGHLLVVHIPIGQGRRPCLSYRTDGTTICIKLEMVVWKLDPNQAPLVWETTFQGSCTGTLDSIGMPRYSRSGLICATLIGVHPYNDKLIYMYLESKGQFILCNTRIGCIMPIKSLCNNYNVSTFHRLEQQWWPTSVPALVQCLKVEKNSTPLQL